MACSAENRDSPCGILCLCSEARCDYQFCAKQHCRLCDLPFDMVRPDDTFCSCFLGESQVLVEPPYPIAFCWVPMYYFLPLNSPGVSESSSISSLSSESNHSLPSPGIILDPSYNEVALPIPSNIIYELEAINGQEFFSAIPSMLDDFNAPVHNTSNLGNIVGISSEATHLDYLPVDPLNAALEVNRDPESNFHRAELRASLDVHVAEIGNINFIDPIQDVIEIMDVPIPHPQVESPDMGSAPRTVNGLYDSFWSIERRTSPSLHSGLTPCIGANLREDFDANQRPNNDANQRPNNDANQRPNNDANQRSNNDANQRPNNDANQRPNNDANQRPNNDANQRPNNDANQRSNNDANQRPNNDANQRPNNDANQRPNNDANQRPNNDANQRPNNDANQRSNNDANQRPNNDANQRPNNDANQRPNNDANQRPNNDANQRPNNDANQRPNNDANQRPNNDANQRSNNGANQRYNNGTVSVGNYMENRNNVIDNAYLIPESIRLSVRRQNRVADILGNINRNTPS